MCFSKAGLEGFWKGCLKEVLKGGFEENVEVVYKRFWRGCDRVFNGVVPRMGDVGKAFAGGFVCGFEGVWRVWRICWRRGFEKQFNCILKGFWMRLCRGVWRSVWRGSLKGFWEVTQEIFTIRLKICSFVFVFVRHHCDDNWNTNFYFIINGLVFLCNHHYLIFSDPYFVNLVMLAIFCKNMQRKISLKLFWVSNLWTLANNSKHATQEQWKLYWTRLDFFELFKFFYVRKYLKTCNATANDNHDCEYRCY